MCPYMSVPWGGGHTKRRVIGRREGHQWHRLTQVGGRCSLQERALKTWMAGEGTKVEGRSVLK